VNVGGATSPASTIVKEGKRKRVVEFKGDNEEEPLNINMSVDSVFDHKLKKDIRIGEKAAMVKKREENKFT